MVFMAYLCYGLTRLHCTHSNRCQSIRSINNLLTSGKFRQYGMIDTLAPHHRRTSTVSFEDANLQFKTLNRTPNFSCESAT